MTTSVPRSEIARAAARPASPAPTTTTRRRSEGIPSPLTSNATDCLIRVRSSSFGGAKVPAQLVGDDDGQIERGIGDELARQHPPLPSQQSGPHAHCQWSDDAAVEQLRGAEFEEQIRGGSSR